MRETVGTAALRIVGAVMLVGGLAMLIVPRPVFTPVNHWVVVPTAVGVAVVMLLVRVPRSVRSVLASRWAGPVLATMGGGIGALTGLVLHYPYGWDASVVMGLARRIHAGDPLTAAAYRYLSEYPNNLPLLAVDRVAADVGSRLGVMPDSLLIGLNAVGLLVSVWLVHLVVRRSAGPVAAALAALLVTGLVGLSPWMAVPYTDLLGMPFVMAAVALSTLAWSSRSRWRWLAWAGSVLCGAAAYVIKTTPVVLVVAGVLVIVLGVLPSRTSGESPSGWESPGRRAVRTLAVAALTVVAFVGTAVGLTNVARQGTGVDLARVHTSAAAPLVWWAANGMIQIDGRAYNSYGGFSRVMVDAIEGKTQAQMKAYSNEFISEQWAQRGLPGMVTFYANKAVWNWNDGMFWAWGEGGDARRQPYAQNAVSRTLMEYDGFHGSHYQTRASITEGVWVAVVLLAGVGLLRAPFRRDLLMLALSTLGIGAFILVFQGRSRYLLTFVPVVVALSCAALPWARGHLGAWFFRERSVRG